MIVGGTDAGTVSSTPTQMDSSPGTRITFKYEIKISDGGAPLNIKDLGWHLHLTAIRIRERIDGPDVLTLRFRNVGDFPFSDSGLLSEGSTIKVKLGWAGHALVDHGTYRITQPIQRYGKRNEVEVQALGEEILLARTGDRRRSWEENPDGIRDSDIAKKIAEEYGLETDEIDDTDPRYQVVIQNSSDWDFLQSRAKLYGYQLFAKDGQLHFHEPKRENSRGKLSFLSSAKDNISAVELRVNTFRNAPQVKKDQVELATFGVLSGGSSDGPDFLAEAAENPVLAQDVVARVGRSQTYLIGEGHLNDPAEIQRQTERFFRSSAWTVVSMVCKSIGLEFIRANQTIEVVMGELRRFAGDYLIAWVDHTFDTSQTGTYVSQYGLTRSFITGTGDDPNFLGSGAPPSTPDAPSNTDRENPVREIAALELVSGGVLGVIE